MSPDKDRAVSVVEHCSYDDGGRFRIDRQYIDGLLTDKRRPFPALVIPPLRPILSIKEDDDKFIIATRMKMSDIQDLQDLTESLCPTETEE